MNLNRQNIFLLDGTGAVVSMLFTGLILPYFSNWTGLSKQLLYCLALFPLMYSIFSFSCYRLVKEVKSWMLLTIIAANLFYCLISGVIIFILDGITPWGQALLIMEVLIIFGVVALELKVYRQGSLNPENSSNSIK